MRNGNLSIVANSFLDKKELDKFVYFLQNDLSKNIIESNITNYGVLNTNPKDAITDSFKVGTGSNTGTVNVLSDSYAVNNENKVMFLPPTDNIAIKDENGIAIEDSWAWMKIGLREEKFEDGFVDIGADGTITGSNTAFNDVLRGQSTGFPTYVKFFTLDNATGTITPANNSGLYEVNSVVNDTSFIISGENFLPENSLKYVVFGTFALGQSTEVLNSGGIYNYNGTQITFVEEVQVGIPPTSELEDGKEFFIARVFHNTTTNSVTVQDKRLFSAGDPLVKYDYYFRWAELNTTALKDADNLSSEDIEAWLAKLGLTDLVIDSGWINCENPEGHGTFTVQVRRIGNVVNILGEVTAIWDTASIAFKVPTSIPPTPIPTGACLLTTSDVNVNVRTDTDGLTWEVVNTVGSSTPVRVNLTYFV